MWDGPHADVGELYGRTWICDGQSQDWIWIWGSFQKSTPFFLVSPPYNCADFESDQKNTEKWAY